MQIAGLDHLVLTVRDIERTVTFYAEVLGMEPQIGPTGRVSLHFGRQKINLHRFSREFKPCAQKPTPGSADLCFLVEGPIEDICRELEAQRVPVEEGPVLRTGAQGQLLSVYVRDPDGNLVELSYYQNEPARSGADGNADRLPAMTKDTPQRP